MLTQQAAKIQDKYRKIALHSKSKHPIFYAWTQSRTSSLISPRNQPHHPPHHPSYERRLSTSCNRTPSKLPHTSLQHMVIMNCGNCSSKFFKLTSRENSSIISTRVTSCNIGPFLDVKTKSILVT